ncbi:hypothetical protein SADUNF_Sadunf07G0002300 [Salix dunnii]|uniref:Uncharacterized protein n=1 Tax=Salix dunnii TaxID=1413687 RepID=A0A835JZA3_9ROSI|nr:hypothetical protein SADUNF_Sadunf07G0002300 [Salix dunnii]
MSLPSPHTAAEQEKKRAVLKKNTITSSVAQSKICTITVTGSAKRVTAFQSNISCYGYEAGVGFGHVLRAAYQNGVNGFPWNPATINMWCGQQNLKLGKHRQRKISTDGMEMGEFDSFMELLARAGDCAAMLGGFDFLRNIQKDGGRGQSYLLCPARPKVVSSTVTDGACSLLELQLQVVLRNVSRTSSTMVMPEKLKEPAVPGSDILQGPI